MKTIGFLITVLLLAGCIGGDNLDTNPNPSCQYEVYRHSVSGWLLSAPDVHMVFWGTYWDTDAGRAQQNQYQSTWNDLYAQRDIFNRLAEYGVQEGTLDPNAYDTNATPITIPTDGGVNTIADNTIVGEINNEIQYGYLPPAIDQKTFYIVFIPMGYTTSTLENGFAGYHNTGNYGNTQYAYAVIGYNPDPSVGNITVSHETYEAMTDPDLTYGYYASGDEQEVADLCNWITTTIDGYQVQRLWSEKLCTCL